MHTKLEQILCFVTLATILSACSVTRHSRTARHEQRSVSPHSVSTSDLTFIDDISIKEGKKATLHNVDAYRSKSHSSVSTKATELQQEFSKFLGMAPKDVMQNPTLWTFIDYWWGVPYHYGGTTKNGVDCSAFTQTLYKKVYQIQYLPRTARAQYKDSKKIKHIKDLKPGDLVFFKIHSRYISHVGVYLQNNKFVNATLSSGVTISDLTDSYWRRYFVGGGRLKETDNINISYNSPQGL